MSRPVALLTLLLCTSIWGLAFVAQKTAMSIMGPLTFSASRFLLGGLVILPFALLEYRHRTRAGARLTRRQWGFILLLAVVFFFGSWFQQAGIAQTSVTNAGFLTALYVLVVPVVAFVALRLRPHPIIYLGAPLALLGIFYLNGGTLDELNAGDLLVIVSALFWGVHVFLIGQVGRNTGMPIFISGMSFLVGGALAAGFAFALETPSLAALNAGLVEILYAGVLSTALAFSLQAIGQQYMPAANAAIVLSSESLFAALGGALLLGERLTPIGYFGAALIFLAIILVEAIPAWRERKRPAVA